MKIDIDRGDLKGSPFPFLLSELARQKRTGMISFRRDDILKSVFVDEGMIVYAQSSIAEEQLTDYMLRGGVYDDEQYGKISDVVRVFGWMSPQLKQLDFIKPSTIEFWLKTLIRDIIMSLIGWNYGEYQFTDGRKPSRTCIPVSLEPLKILFACIRRISDINLLMSWLGELDSIPSLNQELLKSSGNELNLTPQEGFFLSRVDGSLTIKQLISLAGNQRADMVRFFVGSLLSGLIMMGPPKAPASKTVKMTIPIVSALVEEQKVVEKLQQLNPDENTEDVMLTATELKELEMLGAKLRSSAEEEDDRQDLQQSSEKVGLGAKLAYMRDGEYVSATEDSSGAIDISKLKGVSHDKSRSSIGGDDHIKVIIDGVEVDAEANYLGFSSAQDIFSSDSADEQWNRFMMITLDESEEDFLKDWEETWKNWEEQFNEMKSLREHRRKVSEEMHACLDREKRESYEHHLLEIDNNIERMIKHKKKEVLKAFRSSQVQNHYEVLKLTEDASLQAIKESYFHWLKQYQLDERLAEEFEPLKEQLNKLTDKLHQAYEVLSDENARIKYDDELSQQRNMTKIIGMRKLEMATEHYKSGLNALKRGDTMLAIKFIRASVSLDPRNPIYFHEMARILCLNPKWFSESLRYFHRAFHLDPENKDILLEVANLSMKLDRYHFAEKALEQILKADPMNGKAIKMLKDLKKQFLS